jgi:uncharacterized RDD family membrane protein YckC
LKGLRALSTLASPPTPLSPWKQEVNRRLAAHKNRKSNSVDDQNGSAESQMMSNNRAAAAAARVAARYAKVPSFSEMQAAEARTALRAAEATTRAALEAQAAVQAVLDHIETRAGEAIDFDVPAQGSRDSAPEWHSHYTMATHQAFSPESEDVKILWEPDMPGRPPMTEIGRTNDDPRSHAEERSSESSFDGGMVYEAIDAAQPIAANLIEFPREIVATRRIRPRIAEMGETSESQQLSIFEVDPSTISAQPVPTGATTGSEPTWIGSSWSEIELDEQPQHLPDYYAIAAADAPRLYQAPFGRRMMATMVDTALICAIVCGVAFLIASRFDHLPSLRVTQIGAVAAILGFAALYEWFFLTFAKVTPGMRYAQLSLCTYDEEVPNAAQIKSRLKSMLISVLPMGLGMVWSIFDEDQMSWHDRLSKTYLRLS